MKNTRSSGSKSTPPYDHGFATRRGDIPIGAIQRAYSSNTSSHFALPSRTSASCSGCVSSAQTVPAMASRGSFCPPEIASLMLARMLSIGWPAASSTLRIELLGCFVTTGIMSSIAASIPAVAAWQRASTSLLPL